MTKSIIYILFALFSFSAAVSLTACKDDGVEISDAYKSKTPKNVKLPRSWKWIWPMTGYG